MGQNNYIDKKERRSFLYGKDYFYANHLFSFKRGDIMILDIFVFVLVVTIIFYGIFLFIIATPCLGSFNRPLMMKSLITIGFSLLFGVIYMLFMSGLIT